MVREETNFGGGLKRKIKKRLNNRVTQPGKPAGGNISEAGTSPTYSGHTTRSLSLANIPLAHSGRQYRCRLAIANCGMSDTNPATLTITAPPAITQPVAKNICPGSETAFEVTAASGITAYQWQQRANNNSEWANIAGTETAPRYKDPATSSLKVANAAAVHNHYQYRCQLTAGCGIFASRAVTLTVNALPAITHPVVKSVCPGVGAEFQVSVGGSDITAYQWQYRAIATADWATISTAGTFPVYGDFTTGRLKVSTITSAHNGYEYRCRLTSTLCHTIYSNPAALTVTQPVAGPLANQNVCSGNEASFKVSATAHATCITGYKWQQRASATAAWLDISGRETSPKYSGQGTDQLKVNDIAVTHNGYQYRCRLLLGSASTDLEPAGLYVNPSLEIVSHPKDSTVKEGNPRAAFRVEARGIRLVYKWQVSPDQEKTWADIREIGTVPKYEDKTWEKDKLQVNEVSASANDYRYRCILSATSCSGVASEKTSNAAKLLWDLSTAIEDPSPNGEVTLQVYPNPARHRIHVKFWHSAQVFEKSTQLHKDAVHIKKKFSKYFFAQCGYENLFLSL